MARYVNYLMIVALAGVTSLSPRQQTILFPNRSKPLKASSLLTMWSSHPFRMSAEKLPAP